MVYFGGNDGMLHAVNAGFYSEVEKKFCLSTSGRVVSVRQVTALGMFRNSAPNYGLMCRITCSPISNA